MNHESTERLQIFALRYLDHEMTSEQLVAYDALLAGDKHARQTLLATAHILQVIRHCFVPRLRDQADFALDDLDEMDDRNSPLLQALELEHEVRRKRESLQQAEETRREAGDAPFARRMDDPGDINAKPVRRDIVIPRPVFYGGIAALLALLLIAYAQWQPLAESGPPAALADVPLVGMLRETANAKWGGSVAPRLGDELAAQDYDLREGFVGIELHGGANVIVEAPARFRLDSENSIRLTVGRIVGHCPDGSEGLTVRTPTARIIDLGTEFGVAVDREGSTDTAVFNGHVRMVHAANPDDTLDLTANFSGRVDANGVVNPTPIPFEQLATTFIRAVPESSYAAAVVHGRPLAYWRFEGQVGGIVDDELSRKYPGAMAGDAQLIDGPVGKAMRLSSSNSYMAVDPAPEALRNSAAYTITCIVMVEHPQNATILSLLTDREPRLQGTDNCGLLELRAPGDPSEGFTVRFLHREPPGIRGGTEVFSPRVHPLKTWVHLVAVKHGDRLELYIDGERVAEAADATPMSHELRRILVGGHILKGTSAERPFAGVIDELAIYGRALDVDEIDVLFDHFVAERASYISE